MAFTGVFAATQVTEAPFGLSSVATVVNHGIEDEHWVGGYAQEFGLCDVKVTGWGLCEATASATFHDSTASERYARIAPFAVVVEDGCDSTVGMATMAEERQTRLLKLLDIASVKAAETELWEGPVTTDLEAIAADRNRYLSDGNVTAVASGAALNPSRALALLENALDACGLGNQGVIHMTRGTASFLGSQHLVVDGDALYTIGGTRVVVGSGYKSVTNTATQAKMYATGPVMLHLGAPTMVTANLAEYADPAKNTLVLRAERPVAVTWDGCCQLSALTDLTVSI